VIDMPMNLVHRKLCGSAKWADSVEQSLLPWALADLDLSGDVLEVGPGFGATTRVLARQLDRLTALEIDEASAMRLTGQFDERVRIVHGDGTAMPFDDASFDAVVCFTMLHHVPSPPLQDQVFAEVVRVLRPGGVFAGSDSRTSLRMRLIHVGDTLVPLDPAALPARLERAGLGEVQVDVREHRLRFRARKLA
jgi:SAM-dependent methyltransferase